jgi:hypothetical protein
MRANDMISLSNKIDMISCIYSYIKTNVYMDS